jgi:hypothetical protein
MQSNLARILFATKAKLQDDNSTVYDDRIAQ